MRSRIPGLSLAVALAVSACSGSDAATPASDAPTDTETRTDSVVDTAPDTAPDTVGDTVVVTAPDTAGDSTPDTTPNEGSGALTTVTASMIELLDTIPLAVYDEAIASGSRSVEVELVDYAAASEAAGLNRPAANDIDAMTDWVIALTRAEPVSEGGTGFAVYPTRFPDPSSIVLSDEVAAELGFSLFDIDRAATLSATPLIFGIVEGENLELSPELSDLGGGVFSAGEGDDFTSVLETRSPARPLGRPLRLATDEQQVAASLSTPLIEAWLVGGPSMRDEPGFATAAEALDGVGVVSGYLVQSDFAAFEVPDEVAGEIDNVGYSAPFSVLGIGTAVIDGRGANVFVYVFDDEPAAESVVAELDDVWRNGTFVSMNAPVSDVYDVRSVEQQGNVVVVVATVTDTSATDRGLQLVFRADPVFTNV